MAYTGETTAESHRKLFSGVLDLAVKCRECSRVVCSPVPGARRFTCRPSINVLITNAGNNYTLLLLIFIYLIELKVYLPNFLNNFESLEGLFT